MKRVEKGESWFAVRSQGCTRNFPTSWGQAFEDAYTWPKRAGLARKATARPRIVRPLMRNAGATGNGWRPSREQMNARAIKPRNRSTWKPVEPCTEILRSTATRKERYATWADQSRAARGRRGLWISKNWRTQLSCGTPDWIASFGLDLLSAGGRQGIEPARAAVGLG